MAAALVLAPIAGVACECESLDGDTAAVAEIQSSWAGGYRLGQAGEYGRALVVLRSTLPDLGRIHDLRARRCVAAGAANLIAWAGAGDVYVRRHPGDGDGAKVAAARAWRFFTDCR